MNLINLIAFIIDTFGLRMYQELSIHLDSSHIKTIVSLIISIIYNFCSRKYMELPSLPNFSIAAIFNDPLAFATVLLALATLYTVLNSKRDIEISKNRLMEEYLVREMEELIKPIYMQRNELEYYEYVHVPYYDGTRSWETRRDRGYEFWEFIEANRYLALKMLKDLIINYSNVNLEWKNKHIELTNQIRNALTNEGKMNICKDAPEDIYLNPIATYFDYRFINLPSTNDKAERKRELKELTDQLDTESESYKLIKKFERLIDDDVVLEKARSKFIDEVQNRYETLEKRIDEIRETLNRS